MSIDKHFNKNYSLSDFVNYYGKKLDSKEISLEKLRVLREKFLEYFENSDLENDLDSPNYQDQFFNYLNKYFITPEILKKVVPTTSAWSQVPINDRLVDSDIIKALIEAWENGRGNGFVEALDHIDGKKITPEIVDFIVSISSEDPSYELEELISNRRDLSSDTIEHAEKLIKSGLDESKDLMRIKKLSGL
jgi:hypothetical protein